jgi:hypothetical protein
MTPPIRLATVQPDPAVIAFLKDLLARAESGDVQGVAVALLGPDRSASTAWELGASGNLYHLGFAAFDLACRMREP